MKFVFKCKRALEAYLSALRVPHALVVFILLVAGAQTLRANWNYVVTQSAVLQRFPDGTAQARIQFGAESYDITSRADIVLPKNATVLLVTPGFDPRHTEYELFHRLLYELAPRAVWWTNPAPSDGTWEARWWISSPRSYAALQSIAQSKHADIILFYETAVPTGFASAKELTPHASLVALGTPPGLSAPTESASAFDWNWLGLGIGMASIFALGDLFVSVSAILGYRAGRIETLGLAWALGVGATTVLMFWLNGVGLSLGVQALVIACMTGVASVTANLVRRHALVPGVRIAPAPLSRTQRRICILLGGVIALELLYLAIVVVGQPLHFWDSWVNWAIKARMIYRSDGLTANTLFDSSRTVTQLDYPLLVPLVEAWTFRWAGIFDDRLAGIQAVLFFAALLGISYGAARQIGGTRMWALASTAILASLPFLNGQVLLVSADLPLAVYATITGIYLSLWAKARNAGALLLAASGAGLLPWTKREGFLLLAAFCIVPILLYPRARRARLAVLACVTSAALLSGAWWLWVVREQVHNVAFAPLTLTTLIANLPRLPNILRLELLSVFRPEWVLLLPLIVLALGLYGRMLTGMQLSLPLAAFVYLGAMTIGYVFSDFVPYQQHVVSSIDRVLVHVIPLLVVWFVAWLSGLPRSVIRVPRLPTC